MKSSDRHINQHNAGWSFEHISADFDHHIARSIPLYESGHQLICYFSDFFLKPDSVVYDIGSSTGTMLGKLALHHIQKRSLRLVGIDTVSSMVEMAAGLAAEDPRLSFVEGNALDFDFAPCDMMIANYTVQFLPPRSARPCSIASTGH